MTEKELIGKIRELRQIKPRKDWVVLTKTEILGEEPGSRFSSILDVFPRFFFQFQYKNLLRSARQNLEGSAYSQPIFATLAVLVIFIGLFGFSQNSLPGDILYPIKKISEKSQMFLVAEQNLPKARLDLANKSLEELNKIAQTNQVRKLAPAMEEFQANISAAAKSLAKAGAVDKELVEKTKEIMNNKETVEKVLATKIETKEFNDALAGLVEREVEDLETRALSEEQKALLETAKSYYDEGNYEDALIKILELSQINYY